MEELLYQIYSNHHGKLLKAYVQKNNINKKGGINKLAEELNLTRQGVYILYNQEVIKPSYQKKIIAHLELPKDFFPRPISAEERFRLLLGDYANIKLENLKLKEELEKTKARAVIRDYLVEQRNEHQQDKSGNTTVVSKEDFESYIDNYFDELYLDQFLHRITIDEMQSGFCFEVSGEDLDHLGINQGDFVYTDTLIEHYDLVRKENLYVVIINDPINGKDILIGQIRWYRGSIGLVQLDKRQFDLSGNLTIEQLWEVKGHISKEEHDIKINCDDDFETPY